MNDGEEKTYTAGETYFEGPGANHPAGMMSARNPTYQETRVLIIETLPKQTDTSGLPELYSGGVQLIYSVDNSTPGVSVLTATAGLAGPTIFTLTVNGDGTWAFDLDGQLDHDDGGDGSFALLSDGDGLLSGLDGKRH